MMCVKLKHISSATNCFAVQGEEGNGREQKYKKGRHTKDKENKEKNMWGGVENVSITER